MKEVTITREQFIEMCAEKSANLSKRKDGDFSMILTGAIVSCELAQDLFGDENARTFTREQFVNATSQGISNLMHKEDLKEIATPLGLIAIMVVGEIQRELFNREEEN